MRNVQTLDTCLLGHRDGLFPATVPPPLFILQLLWGELRIVNEKIGIFGKGHNFGIYAIPMFHICAIHEGLISFRKTVAVCPSGVVVLGSDNVHTPGV